MWGKARLIHSIGKEKDRETQREKPRRYYLLSKHLDLSWSAQHTVFRDTHTQTHSLGVGLWHNSLTHANGWYWIKVKSTDCEWWPQNAWQVESVCVMKRYLDVTPQPALSVLSAFSLSAPLNWALELVKLITHNDLPPTNCFTFFVGKKWGENTGVCVLDCARVRACVN